MRPREFVPLSTAVVVSEVLAAIPYCPSDDKYTSAAYPHTGVVRSVCEALRARMAFVMDIERKALENGASHDVLPCVRILNERRIVSKIAAAFSDTATALRVMVNRRLVHMSEDPDDVRSGAIREHCIPIHVKKLKFDDGWVDHCLDHMLKEINALENHINS